MSTLLTWPQLPLKYLPMCIRSTLHSSFSTLFSHCKCHQWEEHVVFFSCIFLSVALLVKKLTNISLWSFVSVSFLLPRAAKLPISPLFTSLLHWLSCICLTLSWVQMYSVILDCSCVFLCVCVYVCASLSPSQPQKMAGTLKELLKDFCQYARGLKAERSLQRWWRLYLIGWAFSPTPRPAWPVNHST